MAGEERNIMSKKGFYTKVGSDFVGVFLSEEGPKMFINSEEYELMSPSWDLEMVKGRSRQLITFYWKGEVKLSIRCAADNDIFLPLLDYLSCRPGSLRHV